MHEWVGKVASRTSSSPPPAPLLFHALLLLLLPALFLLSSSSLHFFSSSSSSSSSSLLFLQFPSALEPHIDVSDGVAGPRRMQRLAVFNLCWWWHLILELNLINWVLGRPPQGRTIPFLTSHQTIFTAENCYVQKLSILIQHGLWRLTHRPPLQERPPNYKVENALLCLWPVGLLTPKPDPQLANTNRPTLQERSGTRWQRSRCQQIAHSLVARIHPILVMLPITQHPVRQTNRRWKNWHLHQNDQIGKFLFNVGQAQTLIA